MIGAPYRIADSVAKIAPHYTTVIIDTCLSFSLTTEMGLIAATDMIIAIDSRYLETVGLLSVITKINKIQKAGASLISV